MVTKHVNQFAVTTAEGFRLPFMANPFMSRVRPAQLADLLANPTAGTTTTTTTDKIKSQEQLSDLEPQFGQHLPCLSK